MSMRRLLVAGVLLASISSGFLAYLLETRAAYSSPARYSRVDQRSPRADGLAHLAELRERKAEEAAARVELLASLTTERMVELGREIVHGHGLCLNCHASRPRAAELRARISRM